MDPQGIPLPLPVVKVWKKDFQFYVLISRRPRAMRRPTRCLKSLMSEVGRGEKRWRLVRTKRWLLIIFWREEREVRTNLWGEKSRGEDLWAIESQTSAPAFLHGKHQCLRDGKRYRVIYRRPDHAQTQKRGFKTKRDAELFHANVEVDKSRGAYVDASKARVLLGGWLDHWTAGPTSKQFRECWVTPRLQSHWTCTRISSTRTWMRSLSTSTGRLIVSLRTPLESRALGKNRGTCPALGIVRIELPPRWGVESRRLLRNN